ncbi:uncharacterized protein METZ01_LOCUS252868 [marine metagenome]|uniref:Uncharacterized protein n=1 Tax=marine metagenome TaxID=408172 RepID=A0A382IJS5_9ZZZZ
MATTTNATKIPRKPLGFSRTAAISRFPALGNNSSLYDDERQCEQFAGAKQHKVRSKGKFKNSNGWTPMHGAATWGQFKGQNSSVQREIGDGPGTRTPNLVIKSSANPVFDGYRLCQSVLKIAVET